jgi:hypothetical protein
MQSSVASTPHVRRLGVVITIASIAAIGFATLLPDSDRAFTSHLCLICGSRGGVDAVLNVLLFVPLGFGLALAGARAVPALPAICVASVVIESAQLFFISGRYASIGDVLTNTLGGVLGFALVRYASILLRPPPRLALTFSIGWCVVWLATQTISSFGFAPTFPESVYHGQIARRLGSFELFRGRVLSANIADIVIPDNRFEDSRRVRFLLSRGATVGATVAGAGQTSGIAPIVRVADADQREIVLLAQDGEKLLFEVRTGAALLRLRAPLFALSGVFPLGAGGGRLTPVDTLRLSGRYLANDIRMNADRGSARNESRISVSAALGWTLVLPFQWFIEGTLAEWLLGWTWTASLLIPLGYWAANTINPWQVRSLAGKPAFIVLTVLAVLTTGLVLLPRAFGLSAAPLVDWSAAITGLIVGSTIATRATNKSLRRS